MVCCDPSPLLRRCGGESPHSASIRGYIDAFYRPVWPVLIAFSWRVVGPSAPRNLLCQRRVYPALLGKVFRQFGGDFLGDFFRLLRGR